MSPEQKRKPSNFFLIFFLDIYFGARLCKGFVSPGEVRWAGRPEEGKKKAI